MFTIILAFANINYDFLYRKHETKSSSTRGIGVDKLVHLLLFVCVENVGINY